VGIAGRQAYHASKYGMIGLTRSATLEYAARDIRINVVYPGMIETSMVASMKISEAEGMNALMKEVSMGQLGRFGQLDEIASAMLWLGSPDASYVISQALVVDGGYTIH
jgi:NAD(P)-dependent dehydrogenase (short-subunit alcohol dehydrogenase family)